MDDAPFEPQSLLLPDTLTVSQWLDRHRPRDRSPHKVLANAILDITLTDLKIRKPTRGSGGGRPPVLNNGLGNEALVARKSRNYKDALAWLKDARANSLFSFRGCCEVLGINADRFRSGILELLHDPSSTREAA